MRLGVGRLASLLLLVDALLIGAGAQVALDPGRSYSLWAMFGMDRETSLPNWFSASQLLLTAALLALAAWALPSPRGWPNLSLLLASLLLLLMSADEAVGMHQFAQNLVARTLAAGAEHRDTENAALTTVLALGPVLLLSLLLLRSAAAALRAGPGGAATLLAGFGLILAGGLALDLLPAPRGTARELLMVAEEGLELLGGTLMLIGAALALAATGREFRLVSAAGAPLQAASPAAGLPGPIR